MGRRDGRGDVRKRGEGREGKGTKEENEGKVEKGPRLYHG